MGTLDRDARSIHGKIVYFGPAGAGKTANLELLARKLKREHRGDLKVLEGESGASEHLPVSLGEVRGWQTSLDIWAAPGSDAGEGARAELLADADGVAFVADLRPDRHDATLAALEELLSHLADQGRSLDEIALVIQYNHVDVAGETAVERLHRRLGLENAVSFDAVAIEGKGVLQTLSALSKQVLALIRSRADAGRAAPVPAPAPAMPPAPPVLPAQETLVGSYEDTALDASQLEPAVFEPPDAARRWQLRDPGPLRAEGDALLIPLRLFDETSGEQIELRLELRLSNLLGD